MALEITSLLTPVSDDAPAGQDLTYDDERAEIESAFERSFAIDSSGQAAAENDVEWRKILGLIEKQSHRTKDIWLAVYLCRAAARAGDLDLVETGTAFLAGLCEQYWDTMYPALEDYGYQGRKVPCESLASIPEFIGPLRRLPLVRHPRLGAFSGDDFERFRAEGDAAENYGMFRMALEETPNESLLAIGSKLDAITDGLNRADVILTAQAEGDSGPNLRLTYDTLSEIKRAVLSFAATPPPEEAPEPADTQQTAAPSGGRKPMVSGRIESRDDVLRAIDAISDYYRRREPTSPVPLLLQRAREWTSLDFLEVLADIAPAGVDEARRILTSRPKE